MSNATIQTLGEVFCSTIEGLAFMFGAVVPVSDQPEEVSDCIRATIGYSGTDGGRLTLLTSKALADELVENLADVEATDIDADELARDALGELMNVALGQFLTARSGRTPVFDLSEPHVESCGPESWTDALADERALALNVEEHPVLLLLETDD